MTLTLAHHKSPKFVIHVQKMNDNYNNALTFVLRFKFKPNYSTSFLKYTLSMCTSRNSSTHEYTSVQSEWFKSCRFPGQASVHMTMGKSIPVSNFN